MASTVKGKLFGGGLPTKIDVDELLNRFGTPQPGTLIRYGDIEEVIGVEKGTYRWGSVIAAWRRRLERDHDLILKARAGEGFDVLDAHGRVHFAADKHRSGMRAFARAASVAERTDRSELSSEERGALDFVAKIGGVVRTAVANERKRIDFRGLIEGQ